MWKYKNPRAPYTNPKILHVLQSFQKHQEIEKMISIIENENIHTLM